MAQLLHLLTVLIHYLAESFLTDADVIQFGCTHKHVLLPSLRHYSRKKQFNLSAALEFHYRHGHRHQLLPTTVRDEPDETNGKAMTTTAIYTFSPAIGRITRVQLDHHPNLSSQLPLLVHLIELQELDVVVELSPEQYQFELPKNLRKLALTKLSARNREWILPTSLSSLMTNDLDGPTLMRLLWPIPNKLTELVITIRYGSIDHRAQFPDGLKILSITSWNVKQDLTQFQFPNSITQLKLEFYVPVKQSLESIHFPPELQKLELTLSNYTHSLWSWSLPSSCTELMIQFQWIWCSYESPTSFIIPQLFVPDGVQRLTLQQQLDTWRQHQVKQLRLPPTLTYADIQIEVLSPIEWERSCSSSTATCHPDDPTAPFVLVDGGVVTQSVSPSTLRLSPRSWKDYGLSQISSLTDLHLREGPSSSRAWDEHEPITTELFPIRLKRLAFDVVSTKFVCELALPITLESFTIITLNHDQSFHPKLPHLPSTLTHLSLGRIHFIDFFLKTHLPKALRVLEFHLAPLPYHSVDFDARCKNIRTRLETKMAIPTNCRIQLHPTLDTSSMARRKSRARKLEWRKDAK